VLLWLHSPSFESFATHSEKEGNPFSRIRSLLSNWATRPDVWAYTLSPYTAVYGANHGFKMHGVRRSVNVLGTNQPNN